ncbi:MAG: hypothetical protein ABW071_05265, partial [Casimicrobiaceae bacterium]
PDKFSVLVVQKWGNTPEERIPSVEDRSASTATDLSSIHATTPGRPLRRREQPFSRSSSMGTFGHNRTLALVPEISSERPFASGRASNRAYGARSLGLFYNASIAGTCRRIN